MILPCSRGSWWCKTLVPVTVWHEIFAGVYFLRTGEIFFWGGGGLIFAIRTDWFFLLGIDVCDFQKVQSLKHWVGAMEIHIFKQYYGMRTLRETSNSYAEASCNKELNRRTWFLSTVFLCREREFKLMDIYAGVKFCGKNVCGNSSRSAEPRSL